jgi:selenophosphate synthase
MQYVLADPQTSGGLLIAMAPDDVATFMGRVSCASVIGEICSDAPGAAQIGE